MVSGGNVVGLVARGGDAADARHVPELYAPAGQKRNVSGAAISDITTTRSRH